MGWKTKDPDARLDYTWDWSDWIKGDDTLATATFAVSGSDSALVVESPVVDVVNHTVTVMISGGTVGVRYSVTCHVVSTQGREDDKTGVIGVCEK